MNVLFLKMLVKNAFCLVIILKISSYSVSGVKYPIVLVPGDGGSQMEAKLNKPSTVHYVCDKTSDWFSLWLNMELLVPVIIDCFIDNMRLVYDNNTRTTRNSPGVETRIPGFGNCSSVEYIDPSKMSVGCYYKDIGIMLKNLGYVDGISLRGAPYDFRKGPNEHAEYFSALKKMIEDTYSVNGNKQVVLIVHSLGGLMTLTMLHQTTQSWRDKYIRSMISLSGAWGGSAKAVKVYAIGDDLGAIVLSGSVLRAEQISSPSLAWLLPSPHLWDRDEVLVQTETKNYSLSNLKEFFDDIDYRTGWDMYSDVSPYLTDFEPPGVEVHCLYGYGTPTVEKLYYPKEQFPHNPKLMTGDGDGTVNRRSLQACTKWMKKQKQRIYEYPMRSLDHMSILKSVQTLEYIKKILTKL